MLKRTGKSEKKRPTDMKNIVFKSVLVREKYCMFTSLEI